MYVKELKFRNFINMNDKPVPFEELDEKIKQEVSAKLSKRFYNAVGLDVTLDTNEREKETGYICKEK